MSQPIAIAWLLFVTSCAPECGHPPGTEEQSVPENPTLKERLTPEQYHVTQECGTEPPFRNAYWNNHAAGLYVDVVSGEPLFSSLDKFDSGTGWPSFTRPLEEKNVVRREDMSHGMQRVEVRSKGAGSHLGHVFDDGPGPRGERYCINSAALRFVPFEELEQQGYGAYRSLFAGSSATEEAGVLGQAVETATFAGGCFWGVEDLIRKLPGVLDTEVGYTGGTSADPRYEQVKTGRTGHAEAVQVRFDPRVVSYEAILDYFFRLHDPTTKDRQGNDVGSQYRSAIFVHDDGQRRVAEKVRKRVDASGKWKRPVVTAIEPASTFYPAEAYHQDYLVHHPDGYTCHFVRD